MFIKNKIVGWIEKYKGTNLWDVLSIVHRLWDKGRDLGILPERTWGPGVGSNMEPPK